MQVGAPILVIIIALFALQVEIGTPLMTIRYLHFVFCLFFGEGILFSVFSPGHVTAHTFHYFWDTLNLENSL